MAMTSKSPVTAPVERGTSPVVGDVETLLQSLVGDLTLEPERAGRRGRPRILPSLCLWSGLIVCVLRGFSSQLALWRLLTQLGLWDYPRYAVGDQAVYKRLASEGVRPLQRLFVQVSRHLATRLDPLLPPLDRTLAPFATDIVAIDETTLDPLARRLPSQDGALPSGRILPGKLAGVFDIRRQQWRAVQFLADAQQNEKVAARGFLATLSRGSLVLADLGYFSFAWFDDLTAHGLWWVSRLRQQTSYRVERTFVQHGDTFDGLVWLGAYRADRARHLVRLVQYRHGATLHRYITNVRDPEQLPLASMVTLYARRWDFELAVALVKQHLGLHLWWSTKDLVVQQQLFAVLLIAQILQALRLEIALRAEVDVFDVSLPLLVQYLPQFAARGEDPVEAVLACGRAAGFIRPSRRIRYTTPDPPLAPAWTIGAVPITRTPRHAGRKCARRAA
jgi:hypothetical protein